MDEFEYDNLYDNDNFDDEDEYPKPTKHKPLMTKNLYKKAEDTDKVKDESEDLIQDFYADKEVNEGLKQDNTPISKPNKQLAPIQQPKVMKKQESIPKKNIHQQGDDDIEEFIDSTIDNNYSKKDGQYSTMSPDPKKEDIESKYDEIGTTDRKVALENSNEIVENIEDNVEFGERKDDSIDKGYTDYDIKDKKTYESKSIEQKQPQSSHRRGIPSHEEVNYNKNVNVGVNYGQQGGNMDKLREQNIRLKNELRALAKAADEALRRERQKRMQKKPKEIEDAELKEKMMELREQLGKIDQVKHQIQIMKRQLENTYNLPKVIEKEDELRAAQRELNKVMNEKNSLLKIKKEQNKALDFLNNEGEYDKKLKQVTVELRKAKEENRRQNDLFLENDKVMKRLHERIIVMEEKCKELQKLIKQKKNDKSSTEPEIDDNEIKKLEEQLLELQDRKKHLDSNFDADVRQLKHKKAQIQAENSKLSQYLKEKEKEIRLNNLRLKELRKLSKLNSIKPNATNQSLTNVREDSLSDGKRTPRGGSKDSKKNSSRRSSNGKNQYTSSNKGGSKQSIGAGSEEYAKDDYEPIASDEMKQSGGMEKQNLTQENNDKAAIEHSNVRGDDDTHQEVSYGEEKFEEDLIDDFSVEKEQKAFKIPDDPKISDKLNQTPKHNTTSGNQIGTTNNDDDVGQSKGVYSKPFAKKKK